MRRWQTKECSQHHREKPTCNNRTGGRGSGAPLTPVSRLLNNFVSSFPHLPIKNTDTISRGSGELGEITTVQAGVLGCNEVVPTHQPAHVPKDRPSGLAEGPAPLPRVTTDGRYWAHSLYTRTLPLTSVPFFSFPPSFQGRTQHRGGCLSSGSPSVLGPGDRRLTQSRGGR